MWVVGVECGLRWWSEVSRDGIRGSGRDCISFVSFVLFVLFVLFVIHYLFSLALFGQSLLM